MHADWPALTHDSDYGFCNGLGTEAVDSDLDGLLHHPREGTMEQTFRCSNDAPSAILWSTPSWQ